MTGEWQSMQQRSPYRCRKIMTPGQIFVVRATWGIFEIREPLVVLDDKHEVGFWTGASYAYGDVMPGEIFEVL